MGKLNCILIMAGGTGGHVFPALAVARAMQQQGIQVHWLGTRQGLEATVIPSENIPLHFVSISGLRGKGILRLLLAPLRISIALIQSLQIIHKIKPDVVLGMGGFVSGPGGVSAWLSRKKLVIHEQNATPGFTNTWLAKIAKKVLTGFPTSLPHAMVVGNPVRADIIAVPPPSVRLTDRKEPLRLLVLGGSLGAQAINTLIPDVIAKIPIANRPQIYHQTGNKHLSETEHAYQATDVKARVVPFIQDMAEAYSWADVVVCRAGALMIAELCAVGVGAILIPFPHAVDDHQTANAQFMVKKGAAVMIQQRDLTSDVFLKAYAKVVVQRQEMAEAAYQLGKKDATSKVIEIVMADE